MKNVIIVSSGGVRYAFELRWVREVVSLGHVTPVPGAPPHIVGVVNVHGSITPVLDVAAFRAPDAPDQPSGAPGGARRSGTGAGPKRGDGAVLVEVEDIVAAIRMDAVEEVSTVAEKALGAPAGGAGIVSGAVEDSRGRQVWLIDPARMLEMAKNAAVEAGAAAPGGAGPAPRPSSQGAGQGVSDGPG